MIFLYHGVLEETAPRARWCVGQALPLRDVRRHLLWLAKQFRIVPMSEYLSEAPNGTGRRRAAITFDDGARATFDNIHPVLVREGLPSTFFVSTGHLCGGPLLWFSYLNALCFEGAYSEVQVDGQRLSLATLEEKKESRRRLGAMARNSGRADQFAARLARSYPLSEETLEQYTGMTREQLNAAGKDNLVEIGSHTVVHPFLTALPQAEQKTEISESRKQLARLTGRAIRYFAYPGGDYDGAALKIVRESGYEAAFATRPREIGNERFEIGRIGIYSPSMWKLRLKAAGIVAIAESVGVHVG